MLTQNPAPDVDYPVDRKAPAQAAQALEAPVVILEAPLYVRLMKKRRRILPAVGLGVSLS